VPATLVKTKKKCCKSGPRCKKCPAVYKQLANQGYAERLDKRLYIVEAKVPKKVFKRARKR
jgi:hypothetical protein